MGIPEDKAAIAALTKIIGAATRARDIRQKYTDTKANISGVQVDATPGQIQVARDAYQDQIAIIQDAARGL